MPVWRCPHCSAPQPETSRCWVCRRSTTCCATCRHYRRAVSPGLGFCGLDPRRQALRGDEIRGCWTGGEITDIADVAVLAAPLERSRATRQFVPVDGLVEPTDPSMPGADAGHAGDARLPQPPALGSEPDDRWSLWPEDGAAAS